MNAIEKLTELRSCLPTTDEWISVIDATLQLGLEPLASVVLEQVRASQGSEVDGLTAAKRQLVKEAATLTPCHVAELRVTMDEDAMSGRAIDRLRIERTDRFALVRSPKELVITAPLPASVGLAAVLGYRWEQEVANYVQSFARTSGERRIALLAEAAKR